MSPLRRILGLVGVCCLGIFSQSAAQSPKVVIKKLDGQTFETHILAIGNEAIEFKASTSNADKSATLPWKEIESLRPVAGESNPPAGNAAGYRLILTDGSELPVDSFQLQGPEFIFRIADQHSVETDVKQVSSLILIKPAIAQDKSSLLAALNKKRDADALIVERNDEWTAIQGIVRSVRATPDQPGTVEFTVGDRTAEVSLAKISAISFFRPGNAKKSPPALRVQLRRFGTLHGQTIALVDEGLQVTTVNSINLKVPWDLVEAIEFGTQSRVWLSELTPSTNDWQPLVASEAIQPQLRQLRIARFDQTLDGQPLRLANDPRGNNQIYQHGISMTGGGRLAFPIDPEYRRLRGRVGFSPLDIAEGTVTVRISADGEELWQQPMDRNQATGPFDFDLEIADKQRLLIEVEYRDGRSVGDQVNFVDVTLVR